MNKRTGTDSVNFSGFRDECGIVVVVKPLLH